MNAFINHLGTDYSELHELVKKAHQGDIKLSGVVRVVRGNLIARLACDVLGMPKASEAASLVVHGSHSDEEMIWRRTFDGLEMVSHFRQIDEYFVERLGPIALCLKLENDGGALRYRLEKSAIFSIPLPRFLSPRLCAFESQKSDKYVFSVNVSLPLIGTLIEYAGELDLELFGDDNSL